MEKAELLKPIVLVEDNPRDLELTLIALEEARLVNEVVSLRDGAEAIDYLACQGPWLDREKGNPAVIMLDIKLPKRNGLEVLEWIRSRPDLKNVPVVILTSSNEEADVLKGYELGVNAYVIKSVRFEEFVKAVQQLGGFRAVLNEPPPGGIRPQR